MGRKASDAHELDELKRKKRKELLKMSLWCATLPPFNHDDPNQLKIRISQYFEHCIECSATPGIEGLCNAIGISRSTFRTWLNGTARKGSEHQKICLDAEQMIKSYMEGAMLDGDVNPVPGIFFMSNQFDYVQKQVVQKAESQSVLDTSTPEQLEHRYSSGMIIDAIYSENEQEEQKQLAEHAKQDGMEIPTELAEPSHSELVNAVTNVSEQEEQSEQEIPNRYTGL